MPETPQYDLLFADGYWHLRANGTEVATADGYFSHDLADRWASKMVGPQGRVATTWFHDDSNPTDAPYANSYRYPPDFHDRRRAGSSAGTAVLVLVGLSIVTVVVLVWLR